MDHAWIERLQELRRAGVLCALATVVDTQGSTSAASASKAIFDHKGQKLYGWIGGGCVDSLVAEAAIGSLQDGRTQLIEVELEDEVLGAGMPCGGRMWVYVEPFVQAPQLTLVGAGRIVECLARLGLMMGFSITVDDPRAQAEDFPDACCLITQDPNFEKLSLDAKAYVVVAAHQATDYLALKIAFEARARYVALVASVKRGNIVRQQLLKHGIVAEQLEQLHTPAGLDLGAITPEEIALSIMAEALACRRQRP